MPSHAYSSLDSGYFDEYYQLPISQYKDTSTSTPTFSFPSQFPFPKPPSLNPLPQKPPKSLRVTPTDLPIPIHAMIRSLPASPVGGRNRHGVEHVHRGIPFPIAADEANGLDVVDCEEEEEDEDADVGGDEIFGAGGHGSPSVEEGEERATYESVESAKVPSIDCGKCRPGKEVLDTPSPCFSKQAR